MTATYIKLIWAYLKIGLFGFGGGYAMLSLIQSEIVGASWCPQISNQTFTAVSYTHLTLPTKRIV